jgi:uncharacterized protein (DUF2249 family)
MALFALIPAFADTHTLDKEKAAAMLDAAAKTGIDLSAVSTVRDSVGVTAVLLTQPSVRRLFGKEIANTYAVVQLTISNKSADAAFVLHSAYIDTSQWALGGGSRGFTGGGLAKEDRAYESARAGSRPNHISSVEARIARGELLDAQQWSARNWTIRLLTVAGSLASGYSFAFKETGIAKGIAAFNGNLVPGVAMAWPDGAVAQQNRISDFGYQTNKVIGKQSGDIVVCFFPIDMFLSAPLRDLFLKSPGLFLSPYQILFGDPQNMVLQKLGIDETKLNKLRELHPCYSKAFEHQTGEKRTAPLLQAAEAKIDEICKCKLEDHLNQDTLIALDYIGRFGVQNIGVYVDGIMTVDIDTVPASIDQVTFDTDASKPEFWAASGVKTGTLLCRFCKDGQISILESDKLGITDVKTITEGSDDRHLKFSFTTTKAVEAGQSLTFVITKKPADPKKSTQELKSSPYVYSVAYVQTGPAITKVSIADNKKVTVTGSGFFNTKANPLVVSLQADNQKPVSVTLPDSFPQDTLSFDVPSGLAPGCWSVRVKVGAMEVSAPSKSDEVLSEAAPTLTDATRKTDTIAVKGEQLVDTSACKGKALKFQLLKAGETTGIDVTRKLGSPTEATLVLPSAATSGDWSVQVLQGTDVKGTVKLK